jgi:hypothetical protein
LKANKFFESFLKDAERISPGRWLRGNQLGGGWNSARRKQRS